MSGKWAGSNRRSRLPPDWPVRRKRIFARDGGRCTYVERDGTRCPLPATDVDHVERGDDHSDENLTSLCEGHHAHKSAREGVEAKAAKKAKINSKFRRREDHPAAWV